MYNKKIELKER